MVDPAESGGRRVGPKHTACAPVWHRVRLTQREHTTALARRVEHTGVSQHPPRTLAPALLLE